jgi:hypothetical protein
VLPCVDVFVADEFFVWAPISRARLVLRLGAPVEDSPRFWAPLWPTRLAVSLETPSFHPTAPLSLALSVLLVGRSSWRLASVLGAPLADSPCVPSRNPKFSPHRTSTLVLSVLFVGRSSCRLASVLGAHFADSPFVPSGNPNFFPHRTYFAGSFGSVGRALLLATLFGFGRPFGRLALRSLWKPQVFSPPRLCRCSFGFAGWALLLSTRLGFGRPSGRLALCSLWKPQVFFPTAPLSLFFWFCWLGAPLADSSRFWAPLWPTRLEDSPRFWAPLWPTRLGSGRPSGRLASVLGAPLADSPCGLSGNPKFSPHRTSVSGSFGFAGWALLLATRLGVGRPSGRLALRSL